MKKTLKGLGIVAIVIVVAFVLVREALILYKPDTRLGWTKPGIAQEELPTGVGGSVVFENVSVVPMDSNRILKRQTVVIKDQRIADLGASRDIEIPSDAHVVDAKGKFLIPGLSDTHTHLFGAENDLLVYLANGVTTIRDLGGGPLEVLEWRDQVRNGTRVGPNIWAWGTLIETNDEDFEWGAERAAAGGKRWVHTPEEAEKLVAEMAALGVDGIKAHGQPKDIFMALQKSADKHGLPFDGHTPKDYIGCPDNPDCEYESAADAWSDFRSMGVPALAHVEELTKMAERLDPETRETSDESIRQIAQDVAEDGLWVSSTTFLYRSIVDQAADLESALGALPELKYVHPGVFGGMKWGPGENYYVGLGNQPWYPNYLASAEKMLLALNESGALLTSGTDANSAIIVPGFSLHDEFETMVDVGLSPYDTLKTSTYNSAQYLGELDEFGTIEKGKRADLVLLEENPLEDITNTRQIAGVMAQGRYYARADLDLMLEAVAQDNEAAESSLAMAKIAFPVVVVLLLIAGGWILVRRVRRGKSGSADKGGQAANDQSSSPSSDKLTV